MVLFFSKLPNSDFCFGPTFLVLAGPKGETHAKIIQHVLKIKHNCPTVIDGGYPGVLPQ